MWVYSKKLQFPVNIRKNDLRIAKLLYAQYGGPDSELSAGIRYLSQRYSMLDDRCKALLTDIGTEEMAHWEMLGTMIYQLTRNVSASMLKASGLDQNYVQHGLGVYPADASGVPWTAAYIAVSGDPVVDLSEDMAAEQKARITYEHLMNLTDDPDVISPLRFLREREVVHFQRFGEALNIVQEIKEKNHGHCD